MQRSVSKQRFFEYDPARGRLAVAGRGFNLPKSRPMRILVGVLFVVGGVLSFLPVLGLWMLPLGFLILSQDLPIVRRWRRRFALRFERWKRSRSSN